MLLDIKLGKIQVDGVLVYSLSRFARTLGGQYEADKLLQAFGVRLFSIIEDIPQQNPMSAYIFKNLVGLTNELQSMQNSAAVQDAMDENARQGFHNGQTTPFGYRIIETDIPARNGYKKRLGIDSENSKIIKHIFQLALYGDSGTPWGIKSICNHLNESGYQEKGRKWNINKVSRILRDTVYIGEYIWGRNRRNDEDSNRRPVTVKVPAIIDPTTFYQVQSGMDSRKVPNLEFRHERSKSPLTGLMVCSRGHPYHISTGKSGKYKYYKDSYRLKYSIDSCDAPTLPKNEVESAILEVVREKFLVPSRISKLMDSLYKSLKKSNKVYQQQLLRLQREKTQKDISLKSLYENFTSSGFEPDEAFKDVVDSLRKRIAHLNREIDGLQNRLTLPVKKFSERHIELFCEAMRQVILDDNPEAQKAYLRAIISKITVSQRQIVVKGSSVQLAGAISEWTPDTQLPRVPIVVTKWRTIRGPNINSDTPPGVPPAVVKAPAPLSIRQEQIMTDIQHADAQLCYKLLHSTFTSDDLAAQLRVRRAQSAGADEISRSQLK